MRDPGRWGRRRDAPLPLAPSRAPKEALGALACLLAVAAIAAQSPGHDSPPVAAGAPEDSASRDEAPPFTLRSSAFAPGAPIPARYTCDGKDTSPPLEWGGVPHGAKSLALVVDDPDAPDPTAPKVRWVHWLLYNVPPAAGGLREGIAPDSLPSGTRQGRNDWRRTGYGGPCPPVGRHRYVHTLYALDVVLPNLKEPGRDALFAAMKGHVIARAELVGTYERGK